MECSVKSRLLVGKFDILDQCETPINSVFANETAKNRTLLPFIPPRDPFHPDP